MTILPKKKATKDKTDSDKSEHAGGHSHSHNHQHPHSHNHSHYHHNTASEVRHDKPARGRTSPTRWLPNAPREELPTHDPGGTNHETCTASISNHNINKRRHRSSPHRTNRKHRGHSTPSQPHSPCAGPSNELENECSGYNSGDEYIAPPPRSDNEEELERWFEAALKEKKGFNIKKMGEDGACLFRSIADQVYGDQEMNGVVRKHCIDYMAKNSDFFSQYVTEDFFTYLNRKRHDNCHGNHLEMQAMSELFNRRVEVYQYSLEPINIFHGDGTYSENEPIRISYHRNAHYNSIVDPYKATIGVGLGLPGFQPGLAENNLMQDAKKQSEEYHIEKAMLEDKMRETDWELTQDTIEEQVARESYLQWVQEQEKRALRQGTRSASATCSSSSDYSHSTFENTSSPDPPRNRSPRLRSGNNSNQNSPTRVEMMDVPTAPSTGQEGSSSEEKKELIPTDFTMSIGAVGGFEETSSLMDNLPPAMFGLSDYDDNDILTQVIAQSQQEYLDSLKKNKNSPQAAGSSGECSTSSSSYTPPADSPS
ncbi:hypothetical protein SNE40_014669 [Patella caerulea]|uniref:ubiquitinyl hydrolase 1 n=1 Tax=Patella caerulea TaxID=87958 RepID=A0AAN8PHP8_PATCE